MTNTTSYLSRDGGEALDFVSDQTQAAEGALAQLTEPSRTTNFVGCSEGSTARQDAQLVAAQVQPRFQNFRERQTRWSVANNPSLANAVDMTRSSAHG